MPGSMMPQYPYLFTKRSHTPGERVSSEALPANTLEGFEVVPRPEALALVAYLKSLSADAPLYSAPYPMVITNASATVAAPVK